MDTIVKIGQVMQVNVIVKWGENEKSLALLKETGVDFVPGDNPGVPKGIQLG